MVIVNVIFKKLCSIVLSETRTLVKPLTEPPPPPKKKSPDQWIPYD